MSVTLVRKVRLRVGAGTAKPGPAIGQALGPLGLNMAEFCKQFNEKTKIYENGTPIPVDLSAFSNRSFTFKVKTPPTSWFVKRCAGVELGSARCVIAHEFDVSDRPYALFLLFIRKINVGIELLDIL